MPSRGGPIAAYHLGPNGSLYIHDTFHQPNRHRDFEHTTFSSNLDDLEDAAAWLASEYDAPQLLVGHSLGGTAALAVAERLESVRAIVTLAAPATADNVLKQFDEHLGTIETEGNAEVRLAGRPFRIRKDFVDDARSHPLEERLRKLRRALLVMHAPGDDIVLIENAQRIFTAAIHPKSFVSLDNADHLLSNEADARYASGMIAAWASRFITAEEPLPAEHTDKARRVCERRYDAHS